MRSLVQEFLPHAPQHGLYLAPEIPDEKVQAALKDYAADVRPDAVLALYDATRFGSAKDGAVFLADRLVFQNNDLQPAHVVRYEDVVRVDVRKLFLGGKKVELDVNQGRATATHEMDFAAHGEAADYVARFLNEAMHRSHLAPRGTGTTAAGSDVRAVERALNDLRRAGTLADADYRRLLDALREGA
ncbi:MAG: hypothetical protein R3362_04280 [Rhodothermales bacterium]|nr:hypothetical protein [Rhodothermales bacterium]